jgi:hypothetical protein
MRKGQKKKQQLQKDLKETVDNYASLNLKGQEPPDMVTYGQDKEVKCPQCAPESPKERFTSAVPPDDPWAHRSLGMRCHSCMAFVLKGTGPIGRCRRNAPTMNGFPVVFETDWCLQHRLDETKY